MGTGSVAVLRSGQISDPSQAFSSQPHPHFNATILAPTTNHMLTAELDELTDLRLTCWLTHCVICVPQI